LPCPSTEDADAVVDEEGDVELEEGTQPAHHIEALSVLATIELKFAQLQDKLYAETVIITSTVQTRRRY